MTLPFASVRIAHLHRHGAPASEYEDATAFAFGPSGTLRLAMADGATEASFARAWAVSLVEAFVDQEQIMEEAPWRSFCEAFQQQRQSLGAPWYVQEKAAQGAAAAFLGLTLLPEGTWAAEALGDVCCCQHAADGQVLQPWWPIAESTGFHSAPLLARSVGPRPPMLHCQGTWAAGDRFLVATDAVAEGLMKDRSASPWRSLERFPEWVAYARSQDLLKNDDATLATVVMTRNPLTLGQP